MSLGTGCLPHLYPYSTNSCSVLTGLAAITAHFVHITDGRLKKNCKEISGPHEVSRYRYVLYGLLYSHTSSSYVTSIAMLNQIHDTYVSSMYFTGQDIELVPIFLNNLHDGRMKN